MKFYSCVVKCGTCQKVLGQAQNVPQDETVAAAQAATVAVCPGHTKNVNLDFAWTEQEGRIEPPPVPVEERTFRGGMINMPEDEPAPAPAPEAAAPAPKFTPDGIALEDLQEAAGEPLALAPDGEVIALAKDENGVAMPVRIIGKNPPRADQLG